MVFNDSLLYGEAVINVITKPLLVRVVVALLVLLVGLIIARVLSRIVEKLFTEIEIDKILSKAVGSEHDFSKSVRLFIFYFLAFITVIMALNELGITTTVLQLLAGAIIVLVVIAVALGVKDFIPNSIAGLAILRKRFVKVGDRIRVKDIEGKITAIKLSEIRLETESGDVISIPNSSFVKSEVRKLKK